MLGFGDLNISFDFAIIYIFGRILQDLCIFISEPIKNNFQKSWSLQFVAYYSLLTLSIAALFDVFIHMYGCGGANGLH